MVLLFSYTLCWGFAIVGLSAPNAETAQLMVFPLIFPLTLRLVGLRAGGHHARLAPGLRRAPAGDPGGRRGRSLMTGGTLHDTSAVWQALAWCFGLLVVLVPTGGAQVPQGGLSRPGAQPSPVRRRSSLSKSAMGTRTCSVVSRSRTVTASSSSESKSTVTHHGVPTSSWRR